MGNLSEECKEVYRAIKKYIKANGYSPSVRDICFLADKKSTATVAHHFRKLKKEGYITYVENKKRTIRVLKELE